MKKASTRRQTKKPPAVARSQKQLNRRCRPDLFAKCLDGRDGRKLVLGIDPGTQCGYAYSYVGRGGECTPLNATSCGIWDLSSGKWDTGPMRFVKLRHFLSVAKPDLVAVEGPPLTATVISQSFRNKAPVTGLNSQMLLAAFRGTIAGWCEEYGVPHFHVHVADVKRRAVGKGNANKLQMIVAANEEFGLDLPEAEGVGADNIADAAFICAIGTELAGGLMERKCKDARKDEGKRRRRRSRQS